MEKVFQKFLQQYNLNNLPIYEIAGGKCALATDGTLALVITDGRYPAQTDGYSINSVCTEEIQVLHGGIILEIDQNLHILKTGDNYAVTPHHKYSIAGKAICLIKISPPWDKNQNSFVQ